MNQRPSPPRPTKPAFTKQELQDFFDNADDRVSAGADSGRKGWLPAYRDAVMFKVAYSYGLRFNELRHLQTVDFARNPHGPRPCRWKELNQSYAGSKYAMSFNVTHGRRPPTIRRPRRAAVSGPMRW